MSPVMLDQTPGVVTVTRASIRSGGHPRTLPRSRRLARIAIGAACAGALLSVPCRLLAQEAVPTSGGGRQETPEGGRTSGLETSFGASLTFASAFVWRGFVLGSDPALQPSVWAEIGPVTISSWSNTYVPSAGGMRYSEHDFSVDYSREVRGLTISAGWINYTFPREASGRHTNEFYAAVGTGGYLAPKFQVYHDVNEGKGTYAMLSVAHEYPLTPGGVTIEPAVSLGYNHHQWTERTGFSDLTTVVTATLPTPIKRLSLQPFVGYSCGFDAATFPRRFYGGLTLAVE